MKNSSNCSAAILLAIIFFWSSVSYGQTSLPLEKVTLQLQWKHQFEFAGFYAAMAKGFYQEAGLDVELIEYEQGMDYIDTILSGEASFGVAYSTVISERMHGKPVVLLANYFKRSPLALVTQPHIYSPGELKGKKVMAEKVEIESANFLQMFRQFNMTHKDMTLVPHTFNIDKFVSGEVDAMTVFLTNEIYYLRQKRVPFNIIDPNNFGVPFYDLILFTSESFLQQNKSRAQAFIQASNKGWKYALEHPEEIVELILEKYNTQNKSRAHLLFEAEETKRVMLANIYNIGSIDPSRIRKIEELFVAEGVASTIVDPDRFIFPLQEHGGSAQFTLEEKRFIREHPTVKIIQSFHQPPFSIIAGGEQSGYLYDLLAEVLKAAGLKAEYISGFKTYSEMIGALQNGAVDILPNMNSTITLPEHVKRTVPVVTSPHVVIGKSGDSNISNISELFGKKVAVVKGYAQEMHLNAFPEIIKYQVNNNDEGFEAVRSDLAQYFINNFANTEYVLQKKFATDLQIVGKLPYASFPPLQLSFGVNNRDQELPAIIGKALASVPLESLARVRDMWLGKKSIFNEKTEEINFTPQEHAFIKAHSVIRVSNEMDWPPFDFTENGQPKGFSIEYLNLVASKVALSLEYINGYTWDELLKMSRSHELDLMQSIVKTHNREQYLNFTEAYVANPSTIFVKDGTTGIRGLEDLRGKKVAIVKGFFQQEYLEETYSDIELVLFPSLLNALKAVSLGNVDAALNQQMVADWVLRQNLITNVVGVAATGDPMLDNANLRFGCRKDWPELVTVLQKGMNAISLTERNLLLLKWSAPSQIKKIPLSDIEQNWLLENPSVRVANEMDWPPFDFVRHGLPSGYSIDLFNLVAEKIGIKVEYINGHSWDNLYKMGLEGKLDLFPCIWKTEEREQIFLFTTPYMDTPYILTVQEREEGIQTIDDLNGRILAGVQGYASMQIIKKHYPKIRVLEVTSPAEGLRQLSYGKADAYIDSMGSVSHHIRENIISNLKIAAETTLGGRLKASQLHFAVRKDSPTLHRLVQRALDDITPEQVMGLQKKWMDISRKQESKVTTIQFNAEEKTYIKDHPVLKVASDYDWPPVEFSHNKSGIIGISADYLKELSGVLHIRIEHATPRPWPEMMAAVREGELDFFSAVAPTDQRKEWLEFTESYLSFPIVIVTRDDVPYIGSIADLDSKMVAVANSFATHDFLAANHAEISLLLTENVLEGLMAVSKGKAFAFVGSLAAINYIMGREGLTGLKVSGKTPYNYDISMAVRKGDTQLLALLNKALAATSRQKKESIYSKWISMTPEHKIDYSLVWKISSACLFILVIFVFWNRRLSLMANELGKANQNLRIEIQERKKVETALRLTEESVRNYADTQTVLLREVNHRVKNNLTAIISMLHKEEDRASEEGQGEYMVRLQEIVGRVMGLLTVHSMLSSSQWQPISLTLLCEAVVGETLKGIPGDKSIHLEISASAISINSDQAHNLAIVLNELATNTVKYALRARDHATINLSFNSLDDSITIVYRDDGPGYSAAILNGEIPRRSIGHQLIKGIVSKNLQGKIEFLNDHGAVARIVFERMI